MDAATAPAHVLADAFTADRPSPGAIDELALFGQFVGSWDLEVTDIAPDGAETASAGEWHFGWALGGRAVADVWICPRRGPDGRSPGEHGVSMRFPDPAVGGWRSTWVGPGKRAVHRFVARDEGDRIVLTATSNGRDLRWTFSHITSSTFRWRNEVSADGGRTWRVQQRFVARRADA